MIDSYAESLQVAEAAPIYTLDEAQYCAPPREWG